MSYNVEFRDALERGDIDTVVSIWRKVSPNFPLPSSRSEAEKTMHYARTQCMVISFKARAYSHRWLSERGLPSGLPDNLKPRAERLYPKVVEAVGVSVNFSNELLKPIGGMLEKVINNSIFDIYADNPHPDVELVKKRMKEVRIKEEYALFGRLFDPKQEK